MAKRRQCARCGEYNSFSAKECKDCGTQFSTVASEQEKPKRKPATCSFEVDGRQCVHIGLLSAGTTGDSASYCREHWEVINGRRARGQGNAIVDQPKSLAILERERDWMWDGEQRRYVPRHVSKDQEAA